MWMPLINLRLRIVSRLRENSITLLEWLLPRVLALLTRLQAERGFVPTEERWERSSDDDRYYREPDR